MRRILYLTVAIALVPMPGAGAFAQGRMASASAVQNEQPAPAALAIPEEARVAYVEIERVAALSAEGKAAAAKLQDLRTRKSAAVDLTEEVAKRLDAAAGPKR